MYNEIREKEYILVRNHSFYGFGVIKAVKKNNIYSKKNQRLDNELMIKNPFRGKYLHRNPSSEIPYEAPAF